MFQLEKVLPGNNSGRRIEQFLIFWVFAMVFFIGGALVYSTIEGNRIATPNEVAIAAGDECVGSIFREDFAKSRLLIRRGYISNTKQFCAYLKQWPEESCVGAELRGIQRMNIGHYSLTQIKKGCDETDVRDKQYKEVWKTTNLIVKGAQ